MIVEDDAAIRRSLQLMLSAEGYEIRAYPSGMGLLADEDAVQPLCFIADFAMHEVDGVALLSALRARGWTCPAILMTGFPSAELQAQAQNAGFDALLEKPFRQHVLMDTLLRLTS